MISIEQILTQVRDLPSLPQAVAQLSKVVHDEDATAADFENIIRPDPALTANLLRLANSAYFGFAREITSVRQAVSLMGRKRVFELAISGSFSQVIPENLPGYGIKSQDFWRHCIAVAVISEQLAIKLKKKIPDMMFTAGLLHDIGKLVLGHFIAQQEDAYKKLIHSQSLSQLEIEREILGIDHAEAGALLSQTWNLPSTIEMASKWHHEPESVPETVDINLVRLVHVADIMAHSMGFGSDTAGLLRKTCSQCSVKLGLNQSIITDVIKESVVGITNMANILEA